MAKKPRIIFAHGWAFHPFFFKKMAHFFDDYECFFLDVGYFGPPSQHLQCNKPCLGIGHSLGFSKLVTSKSFNWIGLVSIGGFIKFAQNLSIQSHLLSMIHRLKKSPEKVLKLFYASCQLKQCKIPSIIHKEKLHIDLSSLLHIDITDRFHQLSCPVLSLHAKNDLIVPNNVHMLKNTKRIVHESGGHGLGMNDAAWCAEKIRDFLEEIC